ncbi:transporter substrate-binding domain-containing protein [Thalassotalea sp. 1_MG-2023]|uniref:substrate-binding periplasmic protein n=1 Tax=Thalassotalea sp. 1_MG-2023 TaxID=3062680 RepID=UPI0026E17E7B|nr:transporter substrate-binding domain-containing protein [Thalassotalea sp. 1_MG-2023]MDO6426768.1 transporter substrate-binding domain-containing protein [Thalassotalea sp. 1_MG-2023]
MLSVFRQALLIICCVVFIPSQATQTPSHFPIKIYSEIWPPFQVKSDNNQLTGQATEQVRKAFKSGNIPYKIVNMRWARALKSVKESPNTLIYSISRTPEREKQFYWIAKLGNVKTRLLTLSDNEEKITHPAQLKKYVIALKRAEASTSYFISLGLTPGKNIIFVNNTEQALKLLKAKRVDFYPISEQNFIPSVNNTTFKKESFTLDYTFKALSFDIYIAANKHSDTALMEKIKVLFQNESALHQKGSGTSLKH